MELRQSENKYAELESDADRLRKDLERSTKVENELRVKVDQLNRVTNDHQILRDQVRTFLSVCYSILVSSYL